MNNQPIRVEILDKVLDPQYWYLFGERVRYSGHLYRNSPYESDDSCGNCDGARCETCKKIIIPPDIECVIQSDKLEKMLLESGVPEDVAGFFSYDDSCKKHYKGYYFVFPSANALKEKYPDKYKEIYSFLEEKDKKEREEIQARYQK